MPQTFGDMFKRDTTRQTYDRLWSGNDTVGTDAEPLCSLPGEETRCSCRHKRSYSYTCIAASILYILLAGLYAILWIQFSAFKSEEESTLKPELFLSLASTSAFRRDSRVFSLTVADTPFSGDPSPELDQAWHDLLKDTTIRVSKEDLDYYNVTSLPLADGSGYASELFMTHELHCLKKVRQWIYKESYFTQVQGMQRNELKRHIDHCIETLRQGIMCRGDVSLGTYTYLRGSNDVTARTWGKHQCIDFEALISWARERAVDVSQPGVFAQPEDLGDEHFTERKPPH
ncbi:hypothetical protein GGR51DRAFT_533740 [Nemania sp. FL0031]|nr:hypothetical protein GGR51DRAFT_533740 [Nemania sp. FL0031]